FLVETDIARLRAEGAEGGINNGVEGMKAATEEGRVNGEDGDGLVGDGVEQAARRVKSNGGHRIAVGRNLKMISAGDGVGGSKVEQGESRAQRRVGNRDRKSSASLGVDMSA